MSKKSNNKSNRMKIAITAMSLFVMLLLIFTLNNNGKSKVSSDKENSTETTESIAVTKDADLVIPISAITETATFYPAEINGTKLEVIAVKAPDGTIRTAFNTCQVCYSSGRGYYEQEGDKLICQNCGNQFTMDNVEVSKGGCNPVPITAEYKTVDNDNITITKDVLTEASTIFSNWKN